MNVVKLYFIVFISVFFFFLFRVRSVWVAACFCVGDPSLSLPPKIPSHECDAVACAACV